jgi:hypothetical protein
MISVSYSRKIAGDAYFTDPNEGLPSFSSGIASALPTRSWVLNCSGLKVYVEILGDDPLTPEESAALDLAHTNWIPVDPRRYYPYFRVETRSKGKFGNVEKVEWFEIDNGDGTYSGLAQDESYSWNGSTLTSKISKKYTKSGFVQHMETESYYTTDDDKIVTKVT